MSLLGRPLAVGNNPMIFESHPVALRIDMICRLKVYGVWVRCESALWVVLLGPMGHIPKWSSGWRRRERRWEEPVPISTLSNLSSGLVRRTLISPNLHIIRMFLVTSYIIPCFQNPPVGVRWVRLPSPPRQCLRQPSGELQVGDNGCHLWIYYLCPRLLICTYMYIYIYMHNVYIYTYIYCISYKKGP